MRPLLLAVLLFGCTRVECPRQALETHEVRLHVESRLSPRFVAGRIARCPADRRAARVFWDAMLHLDAVARGLRPRIAEVHVDPIASPPIDRIETHAATGAILVDSNALPIPRGAWAHELAHAAMVGPRPTAMVPSRMLSIFEEGAADLAATIAGTDPTALRAAPVVSASADWSSVAMANLRFDPHPLGERFLAELPKREDLATDLLRCFQDDALGRVTTPAQLVERFVAACPERSRQKIRGALERAVPAELRGRGRPH